MTRCLFLLALLAAFGTAECARAAHIGPAPAEVPAEAPAEVPVEVEEEDTDDGCLVGLRVEAVETRSAEPTQARLGGEPRGTPPPPPPQR